MLSRRHGYIALRRSGPAAAAQLEQLGYAVLPQVLSPDEVAELRREMEHVFATDQPVARDQRRSAESYKDYRYAMLNKSAAAQRAVGHPAILEAIEPLLGEDCHVIANTAWRNPPGLDDDRRGGGWHQDAGPHVPRPEGVPWDDRIPYPIFAVGAHILVTDCSLASGPTGVLAGSHRSGRTPAPADPFDASYTYNGEGPVPLVGQAGDVALFVSDSWHRRLPTGDGDQGRFFLQAHYGRRDIAQRLAPTAEQNQLSDEAVARAETPRDRTLIGLHQPHFYDG